MRGNRHQRVRGSRSGGGGQGGHPLMLGNCIRLIVSCPVFGAGIQLADVAQGMDCWELVKGMFSRNRTAPVFEFRQFHKNEFRAVIVRITALIHCQMILEQMKLRRALA